MALYVCYELHYRGFAGVDPDWEWDVALLALRAHLERAFLDRVRQDVGETPPSWSANDEMNAAATEPVQGTGPSWHLRDHGTWGQAREYFVHRSLYHLKEGDPHAWIIPRLTGQAKASFVAVEFDEYGAGRGRRRTSNCSPTCSPPPAWMPTTSRTWTSFRPSRWQWST